MLSHVHNRFVHTVNKNVEVLVDANKANGLEVNADNTKYMVMSRDQNPGWNQSIKTDNSSFEKVEELKYLGTTSTNQNFIQEETKKKIPWS